MSVINTDDCKTNGALRALYTAAEQFIAGLELEDEALPRTMIAGASRFEPGRVNILGPEGGEHFRRGLKAFLMLSEKDEGKLCRTWAVTSTGGRQFDFASCAIAMCHNRRLFRTKNGLIGLGPQYVREGDMVTVLFGGRVPYILRLNEFSTESPTFSMMRCLPIRAQKKIDKMSYEPMARSVKASKGRQFRFVGECYVHGIMHGEAAKRHDRRGLGVGTWEVV